MRPIPQWTQSCHLSRTLIDFTVCLTDKLQSRSIGLPWWLLRGKEPTCQSRRWRFNPWIGKIPWRRKRQSTPVFLVGKFQGQRTLEGYSSWGQNQWKRTKRLNNMLLLIATIFYLTKFFLGRTSTYWRFVWIKTTSLYKNDQDHSELVTKYLEDSSN